MFSRANTPFADHASHGARRDVPPNCQRYSSAPPWLYARKVCYNRVRAELFTLSSQEGTEMERFLVRLILGDSSMRTSVCSLNAAGPMAQRLADNRPGAGRRPPADTIPRTARYCCRAGRATSGRTSRADGATTELHPGPRRQLPIPGSPLVSATVWASMGSIFEPRCSGVQRPRFGLRRGRHLQDEERLPGQAASERKWEPAPARRERIA